MIDNESLENKEMPASKKRGRPALPEGEKKVDAGIMCKEKHREAVREAARKLIEELEYS